MDDEDVGPIIKEFSSAAKRYCTHHSYGEFDGLRYPSVAELYILRGLIDGAIYEQKQAERKRDEHPGDA